MGVGKGGELSREGKGLVWVDGGGERASGEEGLLGGGMGLGLEWSGIGRGLVDGDCCLIGCLVYCFSFI